MSEQSYDLVILGAGPGGYVAAIRAAQLGQKVLVVEKRKTMGGVCLNEGCIPSKALLDSSEHFLMARDKFASHGVEVTPPVLNLAKMLARKNDVVKKLTDGIAYLFKKNKVEVLNGCGKILKPAGDGVQRVEVKVEAGTQTVTAKRVLLATGSMPVEVPSLPFDGTTLISSKEALELSAVPQHLVVVGAGYIGLELGSVWRRLGAKVTVVEMLPKMLPFTDGEVTEALMRVLKKQGLDFRMGTKVTGCTVQNGKAVLSLEAGEKKEELVADKVLVAVGRKPVLTGLGLEEAGVKTANGRIEVDENYQTSAPGIYAIGDLIPGPLLAHKASEEGFAFAEKLAGLQAKVHYSTIPGIAYTWPEAASVGRTEQSLQEEGIPYACGKFSFIANGRARCMDETDGFVKILAHKETDKVLGIHIVGPRASDMIAQGVSFMALGGSSKELATMFHAHPTLAEAVKEAALDVHKSVIHA
ncbi:dihydrolipoyl dehydrogenase [Geomonas sp. RF6]|uniref:dihydrolipoyl dehydrogenase n=1 Tax=Geomonas sp. RF6 TaxID=2897342 RepID=UPI001E570B6F|nr:dihydrolipoyl dehydrogenase [Geomonas sp. RF6]UFS70669.1 dihydrolipoyl dehydrogenase [Geomonas sp. RF6]